MHVLNFTDFRNNLAQNLNMVNDDAEILVVARSKGKNVVVMSVDEYNSLMETMYLTNSPENHKRLDQALEEMKRGEFKKHALIEE